jgi:hypothetical protein
MKTFQSSEVGCTYGLMVVSNVACSCRLVMSEFLCFILRNTLVLCSNSNLVPWNNPWRFCFVLLPNDLMQEKNA